LIKFGLLPARRDEGREENHEDGKNGDGVRFTFNAIFTAFSISTHRNNEKRTPSPFLSASALPFGFLFLFLAILLVLATIASSTFAGVVRTLDGKTFTGIVAIDLNGYLRIDKAGVSEMVDAIDLLSAQFPDKPHDADLSCGVMLTDGSAIAADAIRKADDTSLTITRSNLSMDLPMTHVARLVFRPVSQRLWEKMPPGKTGALLDNGDFFEGDFKSLAGGRVRMVSVLFGISEFDVLSQILAVNLAPIRPSASNWIVKLIDGSVIYAQSIQFQRGKLLAIDSEKRQSVALAVEILEIRCGDNRFVSLADLKPLAIHPDEENRFAVDRTLPQVSLRLRGAVISRGISMAAQTTVTWTIDDEAYRTFTCQAGVPADLAPFAKVRFIVLADDREVYASPEKTSVDDADFVIVQLAGVKKLTLKIESDTPGDLGAVGLWGDPALLKKEITAK
jgi:hypothetical protein